MPPHCYTTILFFPTLQFYFSHHCITNITFSHHYIPLSSKPLCHQTISLSNKIYPLTTKTLTQYPFHPSPHTFNIPPHPNKPDLRASTPQHQHTTPPTPQHATQHLTPSPPTPPTSHHTHNTPTTTTATTTRQALALQIDKRGDTVGDENPVG